MRRLAVPLLVAVAVAVLALALRAWPGSDRVDRAQAESVARVVRVVDGDTVQVAIDGRLERLRYIGVDTPESVKPGAPVECFGKAAARYNAAWCPGDACAWSLTPSTAIATGGCWPTCTGRATDSSSTRAWCAWATPRR